MSAIENADQNIFPSREIAEAYADAFRVMLELRRCEGAGHYYVEYGEEHGWYIREDGADYACKEYNHVFAFCPPFPTEDLAQAAIDKVGGERILTAYKFLANVK